MKAVTLLIIMVVTFFLRGGLILYLCYEQTTQYFMKGLKKGKLTSKLY